MRAKHFRLISLPNRPYDFFAWDHPTEPEDSPVGMPRGVPSRLATLAAFVLRATNLSHIVEDTGDVTWPVDPSWVDPALDAPFTAASPG